MRRKLLARIKIAPRFKILSRSVFLSPGLWFGWWKTWKTFPVLAWLKAAKEFQSGEFFSALRWYEVGLRTHGDHPAAACAALDYAYCLYRLHRLEEAYEKVRELTQASSPSKDAFLLLAKIQIAFGQNGDAVATLLRCLEYFPEDRRLLACLVQTGVSGGFCSEELRHRRLQLDHVKRRMALEDKRSLLVDTAIAHFEIRHGNLQQGERLLARVLATGQAPFEAILLKGELLLEQGRILPARAQLGRALQIAPRDPRPSMLLAKSYLCEGLCGNVNWALQLAETACRLSGWRNPECMIVLARVYEAKGEENVSLLISSQIKALSSTKELSFSQIQLASNEVEALRSMKSLAH